RLAGIRLHTRTIIRDRRQAFIGSQSLRAAELDSRRELGLILRDARTVRQLLDTFESDWHAADFERQSKTNKQLNERKEAASKNGKNSNEQEPAPDTERVAQVLVKELNPLAATVKAAVKRAVNKVDEDMVSDAELKSTVDRKSVV